MSTMKSLKNFIPPRIRQSLAAHRVLWTGEPEYGILRYICRPTTVALDIGANAGLYTYWCLKYSASVLAFEPSASWCARLRRAFPQRVQVRQCVVSNSNGKAMLRVPLVNGAKEFGLATLEATNLLGGLPFEEVGVDKVFLDDLKLENVGFIKIDVEGHELAVLQGAGEILSRQRPRLIVECEEQHRHYAVESVRTFLTDLGYRGFYLKYGRMSGIETFSQGKLQNVRHECERYVNNFIFTHLDDLAWIPKRLVADPNSVNRSGCR